MSDPKGPKLDLPDDLVAEINEQDSADAPAEGADRDAPAVAEPSAHDAEPAGGDPGDDVAAWKDRHLRLAAEFENFKRRALKERQDLLNFATENLVKELLATIDNLERALGHVRQEEDIDKENLLEGVELTFRSLMHTLEQSGVHAVEAQGKEFDPRFHEAIRQVPSDDQPAGTVVEVYQTGYVMKNRLLRPALVAVVGPGGGDSS